MEAKLEIMTQQPTDRTTDGQAGNREVSLSNIQEETRKRSSSYVSM